MIFGERIARWLPVGIAVLMSLSPALAQTFTVPRDSAAAIELATRHVDSSKTLLLFGQYARAEPHLRKAQQCYAEFWGPDSWGVAYCATKLGTVANGLGDYPAAIDHYREALRLHEARREERPDIVAGDCYNLAVLYARLFRFAEGYPYLQRAERIYREEAGDKAVDLVDVYALQVQYAQTYLEDPETALLYARRALEAGKAAYPPDAFDFVNLHTVNASTYVLLGAPDQAEAHLNRAERLLERYPGHPDAAAFRTILLVNQAYVAALREAPDRSLALMEQATVALDGEALPASLLQRRPLQLLQAEALARRGEVQRADSLFRTLRESAVNAFDFAKVNLRWMAISEERGAYDRVAQLGADGLQRLRADVPEERVHLAVHHVLLGEAAVGLGRTDRAETHFTTALDLLDRIDRTESNFRARAAFGLVSVSLQRFRATGDASLLIRARNFGDRGLAELEAMQLGSVDLSHEMQTRLRYEDLSLLLAVEAAAGNDQTTVIRAAELMEAAKSDRFLREAGRRRAHFDPDPEHRTLLEREATLRREIAAVDRRSQKPGAERLAAALRLDSLREEHGRVVDRLAKVVPAYRPSPRPEVDEAYVDNLRATLGGRVVLNYLLGDTTLYLLRLDSSAARLLTVDHGGRLPGLVETVHRGLRTGYTAAARALYEMLIAPAGLSGSEELVVIPDGILHLLPFEVLLKADPPAEEVWRTYPYLLHDHVVAYAHSLGSLAGAVDDKQHVYPECCVLGLAPFGAGAQEQGGSARLDPPAGMRPLPASGPETTTAVDLLEGRKLLGGQATLQEFHALAGDYPVVHLATHAVADTANGSLSRLYLADGDDDYASITAGELTGMNLPANMVVLSACETGLGRVRPGEGIESFTRAFLIAGAESTFATLWSVDDASTARVVEFFYEELAKGSDKALALARAKRRFLAEADPAAAHPFWWAGLVGYGDMRPLRGK